MPRVATGITPMRSTNFVMAMKSNPRWPLVKPLRIVRYKQEVDSFPTAIDHIFFVVSLLMVQSAICATCGDKDLTKERLTNVCHCYKVRSSMAAGKASACHMRHARDRQAYEMSLI